MHAVTHARVTAYEQLEDSSFKERVGFSVAEDHDLLDKGPVPGVLPDLGPADQLGSPPPRIVSPPLDKQACRARLVRTSRSGLAGPYMEGKG